MRRDDGISSVTQPYLETVPNLSSSVRKDTDMRKCVLRIEAYCGTCGMTVRRYLCLVTLFGLLCSFMGNSEASAENWPDWRGPSHNGNSGETGLPVKWGEDSGIVWKCSLPQWGNSTPVIWEDAIFLTCHVNDQQLQLLKIDKASGKIQWNRQVGAAVTPALIPGVTGSAARGRQKFHRTQNLASPSCTTDGDVVVAHFGNGELAAYDFDGRQLWRRNLQDDHGKYTIWWGHANSPVLHDHLVISVCMQDSLTDLGKPASPSYVVAHHARSGKQAWMVARPTAATSEPCDSYTTPLIWKQDGSVQIVVWGGQVLDAYAPTNGARLWQVTGLAGNRVIPGPVIVDDMAYVIEGMRGPLHAVRIGQVDNPSREDIAWSYDRGTSDSPTPVASDGLLFFVTNDGIATCLDRKNGKLQWKERLRGQYRASPLAADGRIYFLNVDGLTTVVAASRDFERIAENQLDGETFASPIVSDGQMFIRSKQALYCVGGE